MITSTSLAFLQQDNCRAWHHIIFCAKNADLADAKVVTVLAGSLLAGALHLRESALECSFKHQFAFAKALTDVSMIDEAKCKEN